MIRLLIFWDYDTQWGADRSRSPGGPKDWGPLEFENTERLLELHAQYNIPACFAVVGSAALPGERPYHDPAQIRRIHAAGHEIASHSHRHEWLPGLGRAALEETLRSSKDALEQCIGAPVLSFVPPFNQPFDYPAGFSFSLSERREAGRDRTDLGRLCQTLGECGYQFCRVAYRPLVQRWKERLLERELHRPAQPEKIAGVLCLRNHRGGFDEKTRELLREFASRKCTDMAAPDGAPCGFCVVYGHPHSLHAGNTQDESCLLPFLDLVSDLRRAGRLEVCLPRDLVGAE